MTGLPWTEVFASALAGVPCLVHGLRDRSVPLPVARWSRDADDSDATLLEHCAGPTLDVGCGPGRMTHALALRGVPVLGIDLVAEAVRRTRARGVVALQRDVFGPLPGEGRWGSVLLADGNIGIGGDPVALLRRVAALVAPQGRVVCDLAPPGTGLVTRTIRLECGGASSARLRWSLVDPEALAASAPAAGLRVQAVHVHPARWSAVLVRDPR